MKLKHRRQKVSRLLKVKIDLYAIYHKLFQISLSDTPRKSVTFSLLEDTSFTAYSGNPGYFIMTKSPE